MYNFYLRAEEIPDNRAREGCFWTTISFPSKCLITLCVLGISDPGKATKVVVRLSVFAFGAGRQPSDQREEALTPLSQPITLQSSRLLIKGHISLIIGGTLVL